MHPREKNTRRKEPFIWRLTRRFRVFIYLSLRTNRPNRADSSIQRRLSSSSIINSAISMLKSIAKRASSKRERAETSSEEDADEFNLGAEDANAKRAKRSLGMKATMNTMVNTTDTNNTTPPPMKKADPDSSFITSSLRKSKKSLSSIAKQLP